MSPLAGGAFSHGQNTYGDVEVGACVAWLIAAGLAVGAAGGWLRMGLATAALPRGFHHAGAAGRRRLAPVGGHVPGAATGHVLLIYPVPGRRLEDSDRFSVR